MKPELLQRLRDLEKRVSDLENVSSVSFIKSLQRRLGVAEFLTLKTTTKTATSENVTINEAGSASKIVLDDPDGFVKIGPNQNIPIYND